MLQFKKKKQIGSSGIYQKINTAISIKAKQWAAYLNGRASTISHCKMTFLLVVFCICWVAGIICIVIKGCYHKDLPFTLTRIVAPKHIQSIPVTPELDHETKQALQRIQVFIKYLDSLQVHDLSKYREIQLDRPGLLDSIKLIKQYYSTLNQLK